MSQVKKYKVKKSKNPNNNLNSMDFINKKDRLDR